MSNAADPIVASAQERAENDFDWGKITWLFNGELAPSAEMTFGEVVIEAGKANQLHSHDCEEILLLLEGTLEHRLDERSYRLEPGHAIRIPAGARHNARNVGSGPARMVIAYSRPFRSYTAHE